MTTLGPALDVVQQEVIRCSFALLQSAARGHALCSAPGSYKINVPPDLMCPRSNEAPLEPLMFAAGLLSPRGPVPSPT